MSALDANNPGLLVVEKKEDIWVADILYIPGEAREEYW
ncbi:MAG: hypothetical protein ACI8VT_004100 [Saprospiraceae bacterium]